jgi:hypothetical protein
MKLIYIAHPFGGNQENVEKVQSIITKLLAMHYRCDPRNRQPHIIRLEHNK